MSFLPDQHALEIEEKKLRGYLLNRDHADGATKAIFFQNRGFSEENWKPLAEALKIHGATQPVVTETVGPHGRKFEVRCSLATPDGRNPCIVSIWIKEGTKPPRLITAYPNS